MDQLPLDKEPSQSHRDKGPEECWNVTQGLSFAIFLWASSRGKQNSPGSAETLDHPEQLGEDTV